MSVDASTLRAQRHDPPAGWDAATFDAVTSAIAAALVATVRRKTEDDDRPGPNPSGR